MEAVISHEPSLTIVANMQPVPRAFVDHSNEKGGTVLGLGDIVADGPLTAGLFFCDRHLDRRSACSPRIGRRTLSLVEEYESDLDANKHWHYLSYTHKTQDPVAGFGEFPLQELRQLPPSTVPMASSRT